MNPRSGAVNHDIKTTVIAKNAIAPKLAARIGRLRIARYKNLRRGLQSPNKLVMLHAGPLRVEANGAPIVMSRPERSGSKGARHFVDIITGKDSHDV